MVENHYINKYRFDWEGFDVLLGGKSGLDARSFLGDFSSHEKVVQFMAGYGFESDDVVVQAELFGNFQEAVSFIKKYFLKENNPDGLNFTMPSIFSSIIDVKEIFLLASGVGPHVNREESIWAGIILKVMHTIIHADKDLRHNYFPVIQNQIFDRFYKYLIRDKNQQLFLAKNENDEFRVPLVDFQTKAKKTRESIIIKLLHKAENVAEELFDRIGIRFITPNRLDALRVVKFLQDNSIIVPHNIKPSRSLNKLIELPQVKKVYWGLVRKALREKLTEEEFRGLIEKELNRVSPQLASSEKNLHSSKAFKTIQFTCRQLIKYKDPFLSEFSALRKQAKVILENSSSECYPLATKILEMDYGPIARDIRFFYPFEVQIVDLENYKINTEGEASHQDYKKSQLKTAMNRVLRPIIDYHHHKNH
jgi:uncharacterized protein (TIGR04562 family)